MFKFKKSLTGLIGIVAIVTSFSAQARETTPTSVTISPTVVTENSKFKVSFRLTSSTIQYAQVYILDAKGKRNYKWYTRASAHCSSTRQTCWVTSNIPAKIGTNKVYVRAWGRSKSYSSWSRVKSFVAKKKLSKIGNLMEPKIIKVEGLKEGEKPTIYVRVDKRHKYAVINQPRLDNKMVDVWYDTSKCAPNYNGYCSFVSKTAFPAGRHILNISGWLAGVYTIGPDSFTVTVPKKKFTIKPLSDHAILTSSYRSTVKLTYIMPVAGNYNFSITEMSTIKSGFKFATYRVELPSVHCNKGYCSVTFTSMLHKNRNNTNRRYAYPFGYIVKATYNNDRTTLNTHTFKLTGSNYVKGDTPWIKEIFRSGPTDVTLIFNSAYKKNFSATMSYRVGNSNRVYTKTISVKGSKSCNTQNCISIFTGLPADRLTGTIKVTDLSDREVPVQTKSFTLAKPVSTTQVKSFNVPTTVSANSSGNAVTFRISATVKGGGTLRWGTSVALASRGASLAPPKPAKYFRCYKSKALESYCWSYVTINNLTASRYNVAMFINNTVVSTKTVTIRGYKSSSSTRKVPTPTALRVINTTWTRLTFKDTGAADYRVNVYDLTGRKWLAHYHWSRSRLQCNGSTCNIGMKNGVRNHRTKVEIYDTAKTSNKYVGYHYIK